MVQTNIRTFDAAREGPRILAFIPSLTASEALLPKTEDHGTSNYLKRGCTEIHLNRDNKKVAAAQRCGETALSCLGEGDGASILTSLINGQQEGGQI